MTWRGRTPASSWWLSGNVCFEPPPEPEPAPRPSEASAPPATTPPEEREYLTIAAAARYLDCSEGLIRKLLAAPDPMPSVTLGRSRRIPRAALDAWMARRMVAPAVADDVNRDDVLNMIRSTRSR